MSSLNEIFQMVGFDKYSLRILRVLYPVSVKYGLEMINNRSRITFRPGGAWDTSVSAQECLLFRRIITEFRPKRAAVIGNAFGYSAAYIASVMADEGGKEVHTIDNLWRSGGHGETQHKVAEATREALALPLQYVNHIGTSPKDLTKCFGEKLYDFIFIDGSHREGNVTADWKGTRSLCHSKTITVFHDYNFGGVKSTVRKLVKPYIITRLRGQMAHHVEDPKTFKRLEKVLEDVRLLEHRDS